MTKICSKCGIEKEINLFVRDSRLKNGYSNECKDCRNKYLRGYKRGNQQYLARVREHYKEAYKHKQKENQMRRMKENPIKSRSQLLRDGMRERAKKKGIDFDSKFFTSKYLEWRLIQNPYCECCGKLLDVSFKPDKRFNNDSPSIDRVDSSKGYTRDNVAILCWQCNKHKQDSTSDELRVIASFMDNWDSSRWDNDNYEKQSNIS